MVASSAHSPKRIGFTVILILIPVIVLVLIEAVMRLAGVGGNRNELFIPVAGIEGKMAVNPAYGARYFNGFVPSVAFNPFNEVKSPDTIRIVVLGGSSAAGFPYQFYYGFPESTRRTLTARMPGHRIEVINLGMTAVNSWTIWDMRKAVADIEPDAVLIYAGHNEYYGAFGAGSAIFNLGGSSLLKRLVLRLKHLALVAGIESLVAPDTSGDPSQRTEGEDDRTLMARVVRETSIPLEGPVYQAGLEQYRSNMGAVIDYFGDQGIPVVIGNLAANLSGQLPLGDNPEASEKYAEALSQTCEERGCSGDTFREARDLDDIRFRAPGALNAIIASLAERDGVALVDIEELFDELSAEGTPGYDWFVDHLHPNEAGYEEMGVAFAEALRPVLHADWSEDDWPTGSTLDPIERAHSSLLIERLLADYPFEKDRSAEEMGRISDALVQRYRQGSPMDSIAAALVSSPLSMSRALASVIDRANNRPLSNVDMQLHEALFYWQPFNDELMKRAVSRALAQPELDSMTVRLASLASSHSQDGYYWDAMGAAFLRMEKPREALRALDTSEEYNPSSPTMLYNKARIHLQLGDTLTAQTYFQRFQASQQGANQGQ